MQITQEDYIAIMEGIKEVIEDDKVPEKTRKIIIFLYSEVERLTLLNQKPSILDNIVNSANAKKERE